MRNLLMLPTCLPTVRVGERREAQVPPGQSLASRLVVNPTSRPGNDFAARLIAGFLEGLDWSAAARMGCAVAALKIRHVGARSGLPSREEVKSLVETSPCDEPGGVL